MRFLFVAIVVFLISCGGSHHTLPGYSGSPGELIVVCSDLFWDASGMSLFDSTLGQSQPCLPQPEPYFTIIHVTPSSFNRVFNTHRNIIIIDVDSSFNDSLIVLKNRWANGQIVAQITAHSPESMAHLLNGNTNKLIDLFNRAEIKRLIKRNKKFSSGLVSEAIDKQYGIHLILQKDAIIANDSTGNFCWIRWERERPVGGYMHQISQGIMMYMYPYKDSSVFTLSYQIAMRNRITKTYIKGDAKGSYMKVGNVIDPVIKELNINGHYAFGIRGYWVMENDFMGGPFLSISLYDEKNKQIVTLDGYVYAPQFDKREFLREMEAVIKSIEFNNR